MKEQTTINRQPHGGHPQFSPHIVVAQGSYHAARFSEGPGLFFFWFGISLWMDDCVRLVVSFKYMSGLKLDCKLVRVMDFWYRSTLLTDPM